MPAAVACTTIWLLGSTPMAAQAPAVIDAQALVRRAALNAAAGAQDTNKLFMYRAQKESTSGTALRDMVETREVILARTLTWNGRALTTEERAKEDAKLDELVRDQEELDKKRADQAADRRRTLELVRALPEALIYRYDGMEMVNGRETVRLRFRPNPDFSPTSKETYGLKSAAGTLWVDRAQIQIVRMEAELTENVYIGWGILGHINKGGRLELEQTLLPGNAWRISKLNLDATGKAFFFKTLRIKQRQSGWGYRPVPNNLSIAQAVAALKRPESLTQRAAKP
ncbi:MAG TPA: hypothetical protein VMZ25_04820 [Terriglobales bacterium]|nr:hypothetical protein [Terriglobales bacterium]